MRTFLLLTMLAASTALAGEDARFGRQNPGLVNLKGSLYFLPEGTTALPVSFESMPVQGVLYTDRLDVPDRSFTLGFPGVSDRFEWFALVFEGQFTLDAAGRYDWRLIADDGAKLWIDDALVIDLDGQHPPQSKRGSAELKAGSHRLRVAYFQGPRTQVALQLFVAPPGEKERIFVITDFAKQLATAFQRLGAAPTADGIKVKLETEKLFAPGTSELSADARAVLDDVSQALRGSPRATVNVRGLTRPGPGEESKPGLAQARVAALKRALSERDLAGAQVNDEGWGGDTTAGTQLELVIRP